MIQPVLSAPATPAALFKTCETYFGSSFEDSNSGRRGIAVPSVEIEAGLTVPALFAASKVVGQVEILKVDHVRQSLRDFTVISARLVRTGTMVAIIQRDGVNSWHALDQLKVGERPIVFLHPYIMKIPKYANALELTSPTSAVWVVKKDKIYSFMAADSWAVQKFNGVRVRALCDSMERSTGKMDFRSSVLSRYDIVSVAQKKLYDEVLLQSPYELKFWLILHDSGRVRQFPTKRCPSAKPCFEGSEYLKKLGGAPRA